jgi:hypothetical protein
MQRTTPQCLTCLLIFDAVKETGVSPATQIHPSRLLLLVLQHRLCPMIVLRNQMLTTTCTQIFCRTYRLRLYSGLHMLWKAWPAMVVYPAR